MTSRKRMAVLASPNTGSYPVFVGRIRPLLQDRAEIFLTSNRRDLKLATDAIFGSRPDIIVICGGDGAQHVCLTEIANRYAGTGVDLPQILMLALGTMNDAATSIGVNRPEALLRDVLNKLDRGRGLKTKLFRPMTVNGETAFLYGAGIPVAFLERYYRDKPPGAQGGIIGGAWTIGTVIWSELFTELGLADNRGWLQRLLGNLGLRETAGWLNSLLGELGMQDAADWQAKDIAIRIHRPDEPPAGQFTNCTGLMVTVINQIGMGLKAFPDAMKYEGSFTLRQTRLSFAELLAFGPAILTGIGVSGVEDRVLKQAVIEYDRPTVRMVDGDIRDPAKDSSVHPTRDVLGIGPTLEIIIG